MLHFDLHYLCRVKMKSSVRKIELLAPARDANVAIEAIKHGADAVYMGASKFGARSAAGNEIEDIAKVVEYAHQFEAKVYVTVNTILYDNELASVQKLIWQLYDIGVDALIVQDLGILRLNLPPIALHASTQCDLRTPEKAKFLEAMGFVQLVLARELTSAEISAIASATSVPLEAFVHGALCVSYSGRCQVSQVFKHRSANRGECAQMCRLAYDLTDENGKAVVRGKHLLSLRDFNQSENLERLISSGVSSLKIEGRLKDASYVKNVVAYYRQQLDSILARHDEWERASCGVSSYTFTPAPDKSFNRGFTHYFFDERKPKNGTQMASMRTPKSQGEYIGRVQHASGTVLTIDTAATLANGDGISYFDEKGEYAGFRVNRSDGNRIFLSKPEPVKVGTELYRTFNKDFADKLEANSANRQIKVELNLSSLSNKLMLEVSDERGNMVMHSIDAPQIDDARTDQTKRQVAELGKLGNTIYRLGSAEVLGGKFVPASLLSKLRREAIELLDTAQRARHERPQHGTEQSEAPCFSQQLGYADNVANHLAKQVYESHGATVAEPAIETWQASEIKHGLTVMHTRYCLRRELGACLMDKNGKKLPSKLFLRNGNVTLAVVCDCTQCEMKLQMV